MKSTIAILGLLAVGFIVAIIGYASTPSAASPPSPSRPITQPAAQPVVSCDCGPRWAQNEQRIADLEKRLADLEADHDKLKKWANEFHAYYFAQQSKPKAQVSAQVNPQAVQPQQAPAIATPAPVVRYSAPVMVRQPSVQVVRQPGSWTWPGNTDASLAQHLQQDHGINPAGMTPAQMQAAHDNAHNGYGVRYTAAPAVQYRPVIRYNAPRVIYRSYGGCPGGVCPR